MGTSGPSSQNTLDETLSVFTRGSASGTPFTTSEVVDALDCTEATAFENLEELADRGALGTKAVGEGERVWWWTGDQPGTIQASENPLIEQAQFEELVETVTDYAIFVLDADGVVRTWNEGAQQLKGYERDEIVGEHFSTFYTEADREAGVPAENLRKAEANGRIEDTGWRVRKDGGRFWANVTITALHADDGSLQGFVKITRDMTERHEYEERLRKQKHRFETLVREVKDYAIFLLDADGVVQTWNEGAQQLKGYERDEIVGEHFSTFYTEADREDGRPEKNLRVAVEDGRVEDEGERVRKDGTRFWANVTITALYGDGDEVRGFAKVTRDMTERHEYEQRLRRQRDELNELNQINAVIRDIDQALVSATTREEVEQEVCNRLAASDTYSAAWTAEYTDDYEAVTPRTWAGISDEYLDAIQSADVETSRETERGVGATALQTGTVQPVQRLQSDRSGEPWRQASLSEGYESAVTVPLLYNDVEYGVLTVYADNESAFDERKIAVLSELGETISHAVAAIRRKERERTLTALQESTRELLRTETRAEIGDIIVGTLTDDIALDDAVVYFLDDDSQCLEPGSASAAEADRLTPVGPGDNSPVWASFAEGRTTIADADGAAGDGSDRRRLMVPLGEHGVLAVGAADRETFDGHIRDLVELVAATAEAALKRTDRERRLQRQNDRLDSFASMLAHELRNPLTIGQIYSQQLPADEDPEAFEYVTEAFDRIEDMIDVLLLLARGREAVDEQQPVGLADVAEKAWEGVDTPDATLVAELDCTIRADETYVRHLFRNLFENAVEHGGEDVTVTVGELADGFASGEGRSPADRSSGQRGGETASNETAPPSPGPREDDENGGSTDESVGGFHVADDGPGIPAEERERVFETGYTTAAEQGGTGLGLAFVKELAEVYEWGCTVTESESGGARFEFTNVERD